MTQGFIAEYAIILDPDIDEHLPGKHDQSTHGRQGGGSSKPEKVPAPKKVAVPKVVAVPKKAPTPKVVAAKKAAPKAAPTPKAEVPTKAKDVTKPQDKTAVDPLKRPFVGNTLDGKSLTQIEKLLAEQGNAEWLNSLSDAQKKAITDYAGKTYKQINAALRAGKSFAKYAPLANEINTALLKSHAPADMVVMRGVSSARFHDISRHVGGTFIDKGFSSTTINSTADFKEAQVTIHVFKGAPGAYIAPLSSYKTEAEWLPPSGSHFTVTKAFTANGVQQVVMEYRGQPHLTASQLAAYESTRSHQSQPSTSSKFVWQDGDIEWLNEEENGK